MLKDIKNVMSFKRENTDESLYSSITETTTGKEYVIQVDKEFYFGRSLTSSIVIEDKHISRNHCEIKYENNNFVLYDNGSSAGTYHNSKKLTKEKDKCAILKDGDIISFGDTAYTGHIFRFHMASRSGKRPKPNEVKKEKKDIISNFHQLEDECYTKTLTKIHSEVLNLKVEKLVIANTTAAKFSEFQKTIDEVSECVNKFSNEVSKQNNIIQELTNKVSEYHNTLMIQQECLDNKSVQNKSSVELFKNQNYNLIENDFQCPICNEVMVKVQVANCNHTFCECCIAKWLEKSKICPVCRTPVETLTSCLAVDNYITNACDLIGGTAKEQRDILLKERIVPATSKKQTKKKTNNRRRPVETHFLRIPRYQNVTNVRDSTIEVVDLTNTSSSSTR